MALSIGSSLSITSVLVFFLGLAVALGTPVPPKSALVPKVFVVGLSKTGTTSLGDALATLSLRRSGWNDMHSRYLYHMYSINQTAPLISYAQNYDVLEDLPWAIAYKELATAFPNALFILTRRANESVWLESIDKHTQRRKWVGNKKIFGCKKVGGEKCKEKYLNAYRKHNDDVREFFNNEGKGRLLEMVIDAPTEMKNIEVAGQDSTLIDTKWVSLIEFMGLEGHVETSNDWEMLGPFPKSNVSENSGPLMKKLHDTWARMMNACEKGVLRGIKVSYKFVKGLGYLTARGL